MTPAFKTVAVVGKSDATSLPHILDELSAVLRSNGATILMDPLTAGVAHVKPDKVLEMSSLPAKADLAVIVGGDGTLIASARLMAENGVPLVGVNLGRLGFLTDIPADNAAPAVEAVLNGDFTPEQRLLLAGSVRRGSKTLMSALAMNDVVVSRGAVGSMIEFAVTVDGEFIYTLRADGLIVTTPTGSTAYALSAGGPILHPALSVLSLVPVCPHTLSNRPITLSSEVEIEVLMHRCADARVHFDSHSHCELQPGDRIRVRRYARAIRLLHPIGHNYYHMLREKLHWSEWL